MTEPDSNVLKWWRVQFAGLMHHVNRIASDWTDEHNARKALEARVAKLESALDAAEARIGQLIDKVDAQDETFNKARDEYRKLVNGKAK